MNLKWAPLLMFALVAGAPVSSAPERSRAYPSELRACEKVASDLVFELELLTDLESPVVFLVEGRGSDLHEARLSSVLKCLEGLLFEQGFRPSVVDLELFQKQIEPTLAQMHTAAAISVGIESDRGQSRVQIRGIYPKLKPIVATYVDKGWVTLSDPDLATSQLPDGSIVGHSGLSGSEKQAREAALLHAADQLRDRIVANARAHPRWWDRIGTGSLLDHVAELLPDAIIKRSYVKDSYLETVDKPYGPVYRAHLLVVPKSQVLAEVSNEAWHRARRDRNFGLLKVVFAILAGPAIFIVYMGLDSATRGYLSWPLRFTGVAAYSATVWFLFEGGHLIGWVV